jgi:hypothetical protein
MSDEQKKLAHRHESVVSSTLDEAMERLQDRRNKLFEEGYKTAIEPMHEYLKPQFGYAIHGDLLVAPTLPFAAIPLSSEQLQEMLGSREAGDDENNDDVDGNRYGAKTTAFIQAVLARVSERRWSVAQKELPKIIPTMLSNFPIADIKEIAAELENDINECGGEAHVARCSIHRTFQVIVTALHEGERLNLS